MGEVLIFFLIHGGLLLLAVLRIRWESRDRRRKIEAVRPEWERIKQEAPWWTAWDYVFMEMYPKPAGKRWDSQEGKWVKV